MAQVARRIWQVVASIWVLIPLVIVAATALAYYSYRYAHEMAQRGEQSIADTTRDLGAEKIQRVEARIMDSDDALFDMVKIEELQDLRKRWEAVRQFTPTVESLVILDSTYAIVPDGFYSKLPREQAEAFKSLLLGEIVKDLNLWNARENAVYYSHREYGGIYQLISYKKITAGGKSYYIVIAADLYEVVPNVFQAYLADLFSYEEHGPKRMYQVLDEHDRKVYGLPFEQVPGKYQIEVPFRYTLTAWRLRLAPSEAETLAARAKTRRAYDFVFIILAAATVFGGVGLLLLSFRTERRANRLKSDFIANVSHELKTPLSLIRMFAELLATGRTKGGDTAREYAEIITRESERLSRLIDNVLDFARIEGGRAAYEFRMGDLAEVLSRGLDVYRYRLDREGMKLTVDIEPDLPPVRIDENAMTLVLLNLVDNAVKYAAEGKALAVTLRRDQDRVLLEVTDNGPGIHEDERERIFERFYRTRHVRGRPVRGSGIGLSLVRHIAEAHGGGVTVTSAVGKGSTFTVWLPLTRDEEPAPEMAA